MRKILRNLGLSTGRRRVCGISVNELQIAGQKDRGAPVGISEASGAAEFGRRPARLGGSGPNQKGLQGHACFQMRGGGSNGARTGAER
jgi:hypothetical protein